MRDFRAAQHVLGAACADGVFIVPVSKSFKVRPANMLSCGNFNPIYVYHSTPAAANSHCLFPTSKMEVYHCMSPTALVTSKLHPQAVVRAQASGGGLLPLQFVGLAGPTKGRQQHPVKIFMDCGATHCFIDKSLVSTLKLSITQSSHTDTKLANGSTSTILGVASLSMSIQGVTDNIECLVMSAMMPGFDIILGNDWFIKNDALLSPARKIAFINSKSQKYILYAVGSNEFQNDIDDAFAHEAIFLKILNLIKNPVVEFSCVMQCTRQQLMLTC